MTSFEMPPVIFPHENMEKYIKNLRARPGFEPGTSRTQSENHTPRPTRQLFKSKFMFSLYKLCGMCKANSMKHLFDHQLVQDVKLINTNQEIYV